MTYAQDMVTALIFTLGVMTVYLSVAVSIKFRQYRSQLEGNARNLSGAISWQLIGEAVIGFGTLVFSAAAHFGVLDSWSLWLQSAIRFSMFLATSMTTVHLMATLKSIPKK